MSQDLSELKSVRRKAEKMVKGEHHWARLIKKYCNAITVTKEMVEAMIKSITLYADNSISIEFLYVDEFEKIVDACRKLKEEAA
ncbi:hypothetical protein [Acutalibacter sp. 1XD8-36]|nr:hypothetical protein [Acutalibacter sp. 1XD8-36]